MAKRVVVLGLVLGAVALQAAQPPDPAALCDGVWGDLLKDPAVQQALDDAWKNRKEGTPDEKEIGGIVYRCDDPSSPGKTILVVETYEGNHDSGEIAVNRENGCEMVGFFHTHPGKGEDEKTLRRCCSGRVQTSREVTTARAVRSRSRQHAVKPPRWPCP